MFAFYTDQFVLPLPDGHRFPMEKYKLLRLALEKSEESLVFHQPRPATRGELAFAHSPSYMSSVFDGSLSDAQQKSIGFPWSPAMVERSLRSVGATIEASFAALQYGGAVNLAGGTHHAKHASGGGFCVFNDLATAARVIQAHCLARSQPEPRILVIDLDVHQGDGTAEICSGDPTIFTFSIHGRSNYPFEKAMSDLDIALPDGTMDMEYLEALREGLTLVSDQFQPDFIYYVAGHDAHLEDRLGRLALSDDGILDRNQMVLDFACRFGCPVVMSMAGGYFPDLDHLVQLQTRTICQLSRWVELNFSKGSHHT